MNRSIIPQALAILLVASACSRPVSDNLVFVAGGAFRNSKSAFYQQPATIPGFYIGKYEVTQQEWQQVMGYNPSAFKGNHLPVETVSWYNCVEYCNQRSIKEGLAPYYQINKEKIDPNNNNVLDEIKWTVTIHANANGYRLPTVAEWEYAAGGGQLSKSYTYSGSNELDQIAWYWKNAGDTYLTGVWSWPALQKNNNKPQPVGSKPPNELGLFDMSGNVREWCWDWNSPVATEAPQGRIWKGGGWIGADFCCAITFQASHEANGKGPDQGFRVCRNLN
jgi:formylglycine-generating enzyme required for sulfatase activity